MKNKFLYVFFAVTALLVCFVFSASAGTTLTNDELLELEEIDNYYECISLGDMDGNGQILADDARYILRLSVNLEAVDASALMKADVDGDGMITAADAREALRLAVGLEKAPAHIIEEIVVVPATCATDGLTVKLCVSCMKVYAKVTLPATTDKHITGFWETVRKPDCSNKGLAQLKCLVCDTVVKATELSATNSHSGEWIYPIGKDCYNPVPKYRICTVCEKREDRVENPQGGHTYEWYTTVEKTCTEDGVQVYKCSNCGLINKEAPLPAIGHVFIYDSVIKEPTCEETGLNAKLCVNCEYTEAEYATEALGHKFDNKNYKITKKPTCAENGTADVICSVCEKAEELVLDKLPHTLTQQWEVTLEPACETEGEKSGVCSACGPVTEKIPANGHSVNKWTNVKPASCYEPGIQQGECKVCGDTSATREIEMLPHDFDTTKIYWTEGIRCKENAKGHYKCKNCDAKQNLILLQEPCTNKNFKETKVITEATCTTKKTVMSICDYCKEPIAGTEKTSGTILGHDYTGQEWVTTEPAQCTVNGLRECECIRCGETKKEEITAPGHSSGEWEVKEEATCAKAGTEILKCTVCSEAIKEREIAKAEHTPKNTVIADSAQVNEDGHFIVKCKVECSVCGEAISEETTVTRIAINSNSDSIKVVFDDFTDVTPGGDVYFTLEGAEGNLFIMFVYGADGNGTIEEEGGMYYFTIPEDLDEAETITIVISKY